METAGISGAFTRLTGDPHELTLNGFRNYQIPDKSHWSWLQALPAYNRRNLLFQLARGD